MNSRNSHEKDMAFTMSADRSETCPTHESKTQLLETQDGQKSVLTGASGADDSARKRSAS